MCVLGNIIFENRESLNRLFQKSSVVAKMNTSPNHFSTLSYNQQSPEIASVCSSSKIMDPKFCSPALSRHSLETIITDTSAEDLQRENIYQQPDDVVNSKSFKRHTEMPAAYFQQISLDYEDPEDLQPDYHELESDENTSVQAPSESITGNRGDVMGNRSSPVPPRPTQRDEVPQWKPSVPRKPTKLKGSQLIGNSSFEDEEDYYSEALGSQNNMSPDKFEELYAKVDKTRKTGNPSS